MFKIEVKYDPCFCAVDGIAEGVVGNEKPEPNWSINTVLANWVKL